MTGDRETSWMPTGAAMPAVLSAAAGVGLLVAYLEASSTAVVSRQLDWTAVSVIFIALCGLANSIWLATANQAIRTRRARLLDDLESATSHRGVSK